MKIRYDILHYDILHYGKKAIMENMITWFTKGSNSFTLSLFLPSRFSSLGDEVSDMGVLLSELRVSSLTYCEEIV